MKNFTKYTLLLLIISTSIYYGYHYFTKLGLTLSSDETKLISITFILGFSLAQLFSEIIVNKITSTLTAYKREFEKESIESTESSSKIKVLESKIAVLEKALEDALNK